MIAEKLFKNRDSANFPDQEDQTETPAKGQQDNIQDRAQLFRRNRFGQNRMTSF